MFKWGVAAIAAVVLIPVGLAVAAKHDAFAISVDDLRAKYATPHSRFVKLDGAELHVDDRGSGPVIMLVHGHFQSLRIWDKWTDTLAKSNRVIRIDMPPYGLSGKDETGKYSPRRVEDLIAMLARAKGLKRFSIGGISTGSAVSMRYALAHPDQIESLVLVNAPLVPLPKSAVPKSSLAMTFLEDHVFRTYYRPKWFYRYLLNRIVANKAVITDELVQQSYDMLRKPGNLAQLDAFTSALRFEATDYAKRSQTTAQQLGAVKVPILVMWGGAGSMLPVETGCQVARTASPKAPVMLVYPGAGHFLPIEAPRAGEDVDHFLQQVHGMRASWKVGAVGDVTDCRQTPR